MSFEDELRSVIRQEVRAALADRPPAQDLGDFITFKQAAGEAKKSVRTISNWVQAGKVPVYGAGRGQMVKRSELRAAIEAMRRVATPAPTRAVAIVQGLAPRGAKGGAR